MENRENLVEIKKDKTGTGILIESDGYISPELGNNKTIMESYNKLNEDGSNGEFHCPYPFIVDAVFQKAGVKNANGRIYPRDILDREIEKFQVKVQEKRALGETNHPQNDIVDLSRVSINIIELHWVDNTVVGKLEILISHGFRKYGIISCEGDRIANLILQGCKIGVSSRGLGTVKQQFGTLVVADDFELVTWDVVADPSTPEAWIFPKGEIPSNVIEGKQTEKPKLIEKLDKFNDWLIN